MPIGHHVKR